jgi:hypothetical protein
MFDFNGGKKKKLFLAGALGVISVASYSIALSHQSYITQMCTRGGWYLVFPVVAAFYFSFLHGTFASNVLSILGITASKRRPADRVTASRKQATEQRKVTKRQAPVIEAQKHANPE